MADPETPPRTAERQASAVGLPDGTALIPIVVMPALDEGAGLSAACASLGFGSGARDAGAHLVLVDNGSTDDTRCVMEQIAAASVPGTVAIVGERVRGYVPARVAGIETARRHAVRLGASADATLILQADADTLYLEDYVARMLETAVAVGAGHLIEGASIPPPAGQDACADFRAFEAEADSALDGILSYDGPCDVIVDDKLAGFRLSDYDAWGGHSMETTRAGDAILAETTRLFMRARRRHAVRRRADGALAVTSQRRILEDPAIAFATAGFPRDAGWIRRWRDSYAGERGLDAFRVDAPRGGVEHAVKARRRHMVAMFALLPGSLGCGDGRWDAILARLGLDSPVVETLDPGGILERVFAVDDDDVSRMLGEIAPGNPC